LHITADAIESANGKAAQVVYAVNMGSIRGLIREVKLIRKFLGGVAVMAVALGMTAAAPMALAGAVPAAHVASSADSCTYTGFLNDDYGAGSAVSLKPGVTPAAGLEFFQETTGAWRLCYDTQWHLTLLASPGKWCMADKNGNAVLQSCDTQLDEQWAMICGPSISVCVLFNQATNDSVLCAGGSVGAEDFVRVISNCSAANEDWLFESITP
jgi:hypothetical protein